MTTQRMSDNPNAALDAGSLVPVLGVGSGVSDTKTTLGAIRDWIIGQFSASVQALLGATDATAARTALGLGTAATSASDAFATATQGGKADAALAASEVSTFGLSLISGADAATARSTLGAAAAADVIPAINAQTGTSYNAVLADRVVTMTNAAANTFTVPPNSSVAFPVGSVLEVWQGGAGQTTIAAGSGVTIKKGASDTLKLLEQEAGCSLRKVATDTWRLVGKMESA